MKTFYLFWFFFCAGWGYLLAGFNLSAPSWQVLLASAPVSALTIAALFLIELHRLPSGKTASPPSLSLKPWQLPTGSLLFGSLTFLFAGIWGVVLSPLLAMPGFKVALQFSIFGASGLIAIYAVRRIYPAKFSA